MFICPHKACNAPQETDLEPLTASLVIRIAHFLMVDIRHTDALHMIARHLHQRAAIFCESIRLITDYRTILDAVKAHDPLLN